MRKQNSEIDREAQAREMIARICHWIKNEDEEACLALFDFLSVALELVNHKEISSLDNLLWYARRECFTYTNNFDQAIEAAATAALTAAERGNVAVVEDRLPDDHEDGKAN